ncbi:1684_t:CDS:1, partial [Funneliformis geosporum]
DYYDSKKQHRKREPNMFTSFRKEKMKRRPANVPIDEYIKDVRRIWKGMSEVEKSDWQRKFHNNQEKRK